jgi:hypothetical protein
MSLVTQTIANLLGGVSQRPKHQRAQNQHEAQVNALTTAAKGVGKRPPTRHLARLTPTVTGWDDAFVHVINRDEDERYHVVVANGQIKVFDAVDGSEVEVIAPGGTSYLTDSAGKGFRAVTIGDNTIIVNRGTRVRKGSTKADARTYEALLYVRQADFSTQYQVTLDGVTVAIRTPDQNNPADRIGISTDSIAYDLKAALESEDDLGLFTFTLHGSTLHIAKNDASDFSLSSSDGLADRGLVVVKGQVQSFEDLPAKAPHGFIVEVTGSIDTAKDNYFVQFDDLGVEAQQGVWREVPKPGTLLDFEATTMPHRLRRNGTLALDQTAHEGLPQIIGGSALLKTGATVSKVAWTDVYNETLGTDDAIVAGSSSSVTDHLSGVRKTFASASPKVVAEYLINTSALDTGTSALVKLYKNDVLVATRTHRGGYTPGNPQTGTPEAGDETTLWSYASLETTVAADDVLELQLEYSTGSSPALYERARLAVEYYGIRFHSGIGRRITIGAETTGAGSERRNFPAGSSITVTFDGTDAFTYNVGSSDVTPETVAAALQASIDADADYEAALDGAGQNSFTVNRADDASFDVEVTATFSRFHNSSLAMTTDEHVDRIIRNLTDGSEGTVTANTATTVTATLTGGVTNAFRPGDLCTIVDSDETIYYVFEPIPWKERGAGDLDVVPFPSFTDEKISDAFFYQNRLGFLSNENVIMSSSGDLFNFFRYTATDLRPDDVIDVQSAHADVTIFDSAFLWNKVLYVKSDNAWFSVTGDPALTPTTVRLDSVGKYPSYKDPRPVVMGDRVYFTRAKSGHTQVFELTLRNDGEDTSASNLTEGIPTYIEGTPLEMVGDKAEGFLALLTDANSQQNLYIYSFLDDDEGRRLYSSWSRWEFPSGTRIIGLGIADGVLSLVRKHSDGAFVETVDLDLSEDAAEKVAYLDRRLSSASSSYSAGTDTTTWTLPYEVATNGSQGVVSVVNRTTGVVYAVTRPLATTVAVTGQGDLTGASVYIGVQYGFRVQLSPTYVRDNNGQALTSGRLQVRYMDLQYNDTTDLTVTVSPNGRTAVEYTVDEDEPTNSNIRFPVLCQNTEVTVEIANDTPGPCYLSSIDWEGWFTTRSRRI